MRAAVTLFAGCIAAFVLVVAAPASVDDASTLKAEFLRDYPRALKALEARFSRVKGVATCMDERHPIDGRTVPPTKVLETITYNQTLEFECKLPSMVRVVESGERTVTRADATKSMNQWHARCYSDNYLFGLNVAANGKLSVTSLLKSTDANSMDEKRRMADKLLEYLGAPFCLNGSPMSGFLSARNFSIRSVSRVRDGARELLKVEFEMAPAKNLKGAMSRVGWFTVSPSEAWVLHEYKFDHGDISRHGSIKYGGMQGGVPVPRRFTCTATKQGELLNAQTYEFEKLEFVDVPDRDFTLSAFGLPEVTKKGTE